MDKEQIIREALALPPTAIEYHVSQYLAEKFPDKVLVEGNDGLFNIEAYADAGHCTLEMQTFIHDQIATRWHGREIDAFPQGIRYISSGRMGALLPSPNDNEQEISEGAKNAWFTVTWQSNTLDVIVMHWPEGFSGAHYAYWILCDNSAIGKDFITQVCRWNAELRGEVLVYSGGCWHKDARLFRAIQGASFDNLILRGNLKLQIREDLEQFFAMRQTYEEYSIPWKRGILFVGPPGNGKTHTVKALINTLQLPCLYVKSFRAEHMTEEDNIHNVFERARKSAPCILVLEDLDSLLTSQNRSFFLNELDGFATNAGIVTLATTNHPEKLDPSILDRPSRFDRKYPFEIPEQPERLAYITLWNETLKASLRISDEGAIQLSELTTGFSFAYLKELFLSSMMRWVGSAEQGTMEQTMIDQVETLREQMVSIPDASEESNDQIEYPSAIARQIARMRRSM
jgi:ATPase family associated with various cellular activities (AAA)